MKVVVRTKGRSRVEGDGLVIEDKAGRPFGLGGPSVVTLCRRGRSQDKPFWDGVQASPGLIRSIKLLSYRLPGPNRRRRPRQAWRAPA